MSEKQIDMMAEDNAIPVIRFKGNGNEVFDIPITGLRVCMFYEGFRKAAKNQNMDMNDVASGAFKIDMDGGGIPSLITTVDEILADCEETKDFSGNLAYPTYVHIIQRLSDIAGEQMSALSGVSESKKDCTNSEA